MPTFLSAFLCSTSNALSMPGRNLMRSISSSTKGHPEINDKVTQELYRFKTKPTCVFILFEVSGENCIGNFTQTAMVEIEDYSPEAVNW